MVCPPRSIPASDKLAASPAVGVVRWQSEAGQSGSDLLPVRLGTGTLHHTEPPGSRGPPPRPLDAGGSGADGVAQAPQFCRLRFSPSFL